MKIRNHTRYRTADLRKFFLAGLKALGAEPDKVIHVKYARTRHAGHAFLGTDQHQGRNIYMDLPRPQRLNMTTLALVFQHEVAHTLGVTHAEMDRDTLYCRGECPEWARGLRIGVMPGKAKPSMDERVAAREKRARDMLERWERRLKLAKTRITKWRRKVRYYEKRKGE